MQRIQEEALWLVEQNATLQRELNLAWQSNFGASVPAMLSTSTASVGGPEVHDLGRIDFGLYTLIGWAVALVPFAAALAARSLRACGTQQSASKGYIYPRPKDNPTPLGLLLQALKDSLQFQIKEEMDAADPVEGVHGLSLNDTGNLKFNVGDVGEEDKE